MFCPDYAQWSVQGTFDKAVLIFRVDKATQIEQNKSIRGVIFDL